MSFWINLIEIELLGSSTISKLCLRSYSGCYTSRGLITYTLTILVTIRTNCSILSRSNWHAGGCDTWPTTDMIRWPTFQVTAAWMLMMLLLMSEEESAWGLISCILLLIVPCFTWKVPRSCVATICSSKHRQGSASLWKLSSELLNHHRFKEESITIWSCFPVITSSFTDSKGLHRFSANWK